MIEHAGRTLDIKVNKFIYCLISVFGVGIIMHGYAFFNMLYNTDSMLIYQNDDEWMFGLGRFMMPVYEKIRGRYYPPAVVGFLALFFIAVSVYLIIKMFKIEDNLIIFMICMIYVSNFLVRNLFEQFMHDADAYMFSLMLATIGVYFWERYKFGFILSIPCFVASIGLYQAYLQVGVTLFILLAIQRLVRNEEYKGVIKRFLLQMTGMLLSIALYYVLARLAQWIKGIASNENMNSIGAAFKGSGLLSILSLVGRMYLDVFKNVFTQTGHWNFVKQLVIAVILIYTIAISISMLRHSAVVKANKIVIALFVLILPAGMECVYIMSNGFFHSLMRFPMYIVFSMCVMISLKYWDRSGIMLKNNVRRVLSILLLFIFLDSFIAAGVQYLHKDFVWQTTLFDMTRIIDRLEQTEGYEPGKPVVFVGDIEKSSLHLYRPDYYEERGSHIHFATSYYRLYERYFRDLLAYPIWILSREEAVEMEKLPEVEEMHSFPHKDCIREINDIFVVKVSDEKLEIYGQPGE